MKLTIRSCAYCPFARPEPIPGGIKRCHGVFYATPRDDPKLLTERTFDDYKEMQLEYGRKVISVYPSAPPEWCPLRKEGFELELSDDQLS